MAIRLPFALQFALLVTLAIFWGLWRLVSQPVVVVPDKPAYPIELAPPISYDPPTIDGPVLPPPPPPPTLIFNPGIPVPVPVPMDGHRGPIAGPWVGPTRVDPGKLTGSGNDHEPIAIVRPPAIFPQSQATRGVEGWVVVEFTVTASGGVRDARVVDAKPARAFDAAALAAVQRWRYKPRVSDGAEVEAVGMRTMFRFDLENE